MMREIHFGPLIFLLLPLINACGEPSRPNVLIITADTLRADYLGIYGDTSAVTPNLNELARSSTLFERAAAPMPLTRPSHFSMLTSKYPREHGVLNNSISLPESALTLAEILDSAGYWTAAFVGVRLLSLKSGASQGFAFYNLPRRERDRPAEEVVRRALEWLENLPDDAEFLLWVHLFDAHMPYDPPAEFRPADAGDLTSIDWQRLGEIADENDGDIPASVLEQSKALYRGEIAYIDHWIGELLKGAGEEFDLDETLIVFAADHGECFENGIYFEHAHCFFEPAMRIPLMVRYPRDFSPGTRIANQTSIVDIAPTILQAVGVDVPADFSGRPLQDATKFGDRQVLLQHPYYEQEQIKLREHELHMQSVAGQPVIERIPDLKRIGLIGADWKYTRSVDSEVLSRVGPGANENENLAADYPGIRQEIFTQLQELLALHPPQDLPAAEVDEELRETLEALGYIN